MSGTPRERAPGAEDPAGPAGRAPAPRPPTSVGEDGPDWQELADAVWLAAHWSRTGRAVRRESEPPQEDDWSADLPFPVPPAPLARSETTSDEPDAPDVSALPAPDPEGLGHLYLGPPILPAAQPPRPGPGARAAQLARVLHGLARRVPSRGTLLLDEELTAERMVVDAVWTPWLRPGVDRAFNLALLIDSGPTMVIWREETAALQDAAEHSGAFRTVRTLQVDVSEAGPPTLRPGTAQSTANLGEILDPSGDRIFIVVTDGLGPGWATPAADALLRLLGGAGPTALVQLLPTHLRHRSSLFPQAVTLEAGGFGAANRRLGLAEPAGGPDPTRPLPRTDGDTLAVPVLSLKPGSLAAWADLVVGERGVRRELPVVFTGSLHAGHPAPGLRPPQRPQGATVAVRRFFTLATPTARRLATQLAAVPFEFDLIQQLRNRTMPEVGAEPLAEILMGGLIDWDHDGTRRPEFAAGVREALLATTTRTQLARVVDILGGLPAAGEHGVALRSALRDPAAVPLPDPIAGGWWRVELAVMRALSGPYSVRARRIEADGFPRLVAGRSGISESAAARPPYGKSDAVTSETAVEAPAAAVETVSAGPDREAQLPRSPAVLVNVPPRNQRFVGRSAQLQALADQLADHGMACVLPHPLEASSSAGTSELALEYLHRHVHEYDLICWLAAEEGLLLASLASLSAQLGLSPTGGGQLTVESAVPVVLEALRTGTPYDRWLLVLDGAEAVAEARRHLPAHGPGKVLVTSRNLAWAQVAPPVTVGAFEREESIALLRRHAPALRTEDADRLAEALQDIPLAVEQAGAWHRVTGMPTDVYLDLLHRNDPPVGVPDLVPGCPVPLTVAWNIALERLRELDPVTRRLLDICAHLAAEPIPLAVLRDHRSTGSARETDGLSDAPVDLTHALHALGRLSLATIDHGAGSLRLQRSLQAVLLASLSPEEHERTREIAHRWLAAAWPSLGAHPQEWQVARSLLPHLFASLAVSSADARVRAAVRDTVLFLERCGDAEVALAVGRQAMAAWVATSGEGHGEVARISRTCAFLLRQTGRVTESAPLSENALRLSRRASAETEDLVESLCELAVTRRHQGRFQEARELSEEAVELARSALGFEDPVTLEATHCLGVDLRLCCRFDEALSLDRENARLRDLLLGPDALATLDSLDAVSLDLREHGDYGGARDAQEDLYRRVRSAFGEEHPLTWRVAGNLAVCRRRDGALSAAAELSEETLWRFTARYGSDHPHALTAAIRAAVDRRLTGQADASLRLAQATAPRLAACFGEDHPYTLTAQADLAAAMRGVGKLDEAREREDDAARRLDTALGSRHPMTLTVAIGRANTAYAHLDFGRAQDIDEATQHLLTETLGERHPLTLACTANLSLDQRGLGHGAEADVLQRAAVEGFTAVVRPHQPWLLAARQRRRIECDVAFLPL